MPQTRSMLQNAFGMSNYAAYHMKYQDFNLHSDILISETFENLPPRLPYITEDQWYANRQLQKYVLIKPFEGIARQIYITKMFRMPLEQMEQRFQEVVGNLTGKQSPYRYVIYSAHDTQIANVIEFLEAQNYDGSRHQYTDVPYVSTLYFELHYDENCVKTTSLNKVRDCFTVHLTHNSNVFYLSTCIANNEKRGSKIHTCSYQDFLDHFASVKFAGDYMAECAKDFTP